MVRQMAQPTPFTVKGKVTQVKAALPCLLHTGFHTEILGLLFGFYFRFILFGIFSLTEMSLGIILNLKAQGW